MAGADVGVAGADVGIAGVGEATTAAVIGAWGSRAVSGSPSELQETAHVNTSVDTAAATAIEVILKLPPSSGPRRPREDRPLLRGLNKRLYISRLREDYSVR